MQAPTTKSTIAALIAAGNGNAARVRADSSALPKNVFAMKGVTEYQFENGGR